MPCLNSRSSSLTARHFAIKPPDAGGDAVDDAAEDAEEGAGGAAELPALRGGDASPAADDDG
jgi:hypothetical protein